MARTKKNVQYICNNAVTPLKFKSRFKLGIILLKLSAAFKPVVYRKMQRIQFSINTENNLISQIIIPSQSSCPFYSDGVELAFKW